MLLDENTVGGEGGAFLLDEGTIDCDNCIVRNHLAGSGALYLNNDLGTATFADSSFVSNDLAVRMYSPSSDVLGYFYSVNTFWGISVPAPGNENGTDVQHGLTSSDYALNATFSCASDPCVP